VPFGAQGIEFVARVYAGECSGQFVHDVVFTFEDDAASPVGMSDDTVAYFESGLS
jgi:hypothetical protein